VNTVSDISSAHYPSLFEALRLLPGIAPRQERDRLGRAKYQAARSPSHTVDFSGLQLTLAQLQELFIYDQQRRPRVSRAGAALLLFLFEEGAFGSNDGRKVEGNSELLEQYSKGLASVVALNSRRGLPRRTRSESGGSARARKPDAAARVVPVTEASTASFSAQIHRIG